MKKYVLKQGFFSITIIAAAFILVGSPVIQAQNKNNNQAVNKKYVRFDIGHGALHCPFLSPKLDAKLRAVKGIENYFIDRKNSYAIFNLPAETEMTVESLKKIGTDVGYPADDVVVSLDTKPIKVTTKTQ